MEVSFPLNRGVPSAEVKDTKIIWTFFQEQIMEHQLKSDKKIKKNLQSKLN